MKRMGRRAIWLLMLAAALNFAMVRQALGAETNAEMTGEEGREGREETYVEVRKELTIVEGDDYVFEATTNVEGDVWFTCDDVIPEGYEGETTDWGVKGYFKGKDHFFAEKPGRTTVWVTVTKSAEEDAWGRIRSESVVVKDYCVVTVLPKVQQELLIGNEISLGFLQHDIYGKGKYMVESEKEGDSVGKPFLDEISTDKNTEEDVIAIDQNGVVTAVRSGSAKVYMNVPVDEAGKDGEEGEEGDKEKEPPAEDKKVLVAKVTVPKGGLSADKMIRAVGSNPQSPGMENVGGNFVVWSSSDTETVTVDAGGSITPLKKGEAKVFANVQTVSGKTVRMSLTITVTDPQLSKMNLNLAKSLSHHLVLDGTVEDSEVLWESSDEDVASVSMGNVYANEVGQTTIRVTVDGATRECVVRITDPQLKNVELLVIKGNKKSIGVKGTNSYSKPKWSSGDKKVATVNKGGKVSARNVGTVVITCEVDGAVFTCSVSIGKKQAVRAVRSALDVVGAKYSQARRMQKGYYDCSSLVWRSYKQHGVYFGNYRYAPTAAEIARKMVQGKRRLPLKLIKSPEQMLPGDLLFYARKPGNGRYKNISHVAIYCGNGWIVHASGRFVTKVPYWLRRDTVVVARPVR